MYILIIIIIIISCNKQTECNSLATDTALSQPDHHTTTLTNTPTTTITKTKTNNNNNKITKNHQSNPTGNKDNSAKDTVNKYSDNITTTIIKDPTNMYILYYYRKCIASNKTKTHKYREPIVYCYKKYKLFSRDRWVRRKTEKYKYQK